jgi:orotidine-5'-phosphate decarboxylase
MDKLIKAIERTGNPSVVGLDPKPVLDAARADNPESRSLALAAAYRAFNKAVVDAVADIVPAVKPQIAMYEALGPAGVQLYCDTCAYAASRGLYVLGDVKRGDIGSTAAQYAAHLGGVPDVPEWDDGFGSAPEDPWHEDAITVNPYLGSDGILPFVDVAQAADKDVFVLVRTSNPSSSQLQTVKTAAGDATVGELVAQLAEEWGKGTIGSHGYSRVGAVVGATHPEEGAALRRLMSHTFFLVPGRGAHVRRARLRRHRQFVPRHHRRMEERPTGLPLRRRRVRITAQHGAVRSHSRRRSRSAGPRGHGSRTRGASHEGRHRLGAGQPLTAACGIRLMA